MPKELEEIRNKSAEEFSYLAEAKFGDIYTTARISHKRGFESCYEAMLKTHVPKSKVDKLVEAIEGHHREWTNHTGHVLCLSGCSKLCQVLKEFKGSADE
jgi:hypothetical protein